MKRIWNGFIRFLLTVRCLLIGHTQTNICQRCGKLVNLKDKPKQTFEERINAWYEDRKTRKKAKFEGSLRIKSGMIKYELDLKTNILTELQYEELKDGKGNVIQRKAKFKPTCMYLDASNDANAIRKANNALFGIKKGVTITKVYREKQTSLTVNVN